VNDAPSGGSISVKATQDERYFFTEKTSSTAIPTTTPGPLSSSSVCRLRAASSGWWATAGWLRRPAMK
jgi:hypothetical protein